MKKLLLVLIMLSLSSLSYADLSFQLEQLVGYTIVSTKRISGYYDSGGEKHNDFQGCNYNRKILFLDGTYLTCLSYGYQYSYMPTAIILYNGHIIKMVVDDQIYTMSKY